MARKKRRKWVSDDEQLLARTLKTTKRQTDHEIRIKVTQKELQAFEAWRREAGLTRNAAARLALKKIQANGTFRAIAHNRGGRPTWHKWKRQDNTPHQPENGGNTN